MIISEKQIYELMNIARIVTVQREISITLARKVADLIYDIEKQQSEELKVIE